MDKLSGGLGADKLTGGGDDTLASSAGDDTFVYASCDEHDNVSDFDRGSLTEEIEVSDVSLTNFAALQALMLGFDSDTNDDIALIDFESDDTLSIIGTLSTNLVSANLTL